MNDPAHRRAGWLWAAAAAAALVAVLLLLPARITDSWRQALTHPRVKTSAPAARSPRAPAPNLHPPGTPVPATPPPTPTSAPPAARAAQAGEPAGQALQVEWGPVATGFARDFADPGLSHQDWMARTSRWTTTSLAALDDAVDPAAVPAATVTAVEPTEVGQDVVDVAATYDTGLRLLYCLQDSPTGWKVTTVVPANG